MILQNEEECKYFKDLSTYFRYLSYLDVYYSRFFILQSFGAARATTNREYLCPRQSPEVLSDQITSL